ncbi:hypothetical protein VNO77_15273 [Canavalia gladiata]|uniref:Uncharacterized protein n=1 Tax=Canavalia gladiata TaxID=3824 RepID=A0AAN9M037_CANGL
MKNLPRHREIGDVYSLTSANQNSPRRQVGMRQQPLRSDEHGWTRCGHRAIRNEDALVQLFISPMQNTYSAPNIGNYSSAPQILHMSSHVEYPKSLLSNSQIPNLSSPDELPQGPREVP